MCVCVCVCVVLCLKEVSRFMISLSLSFKIKKIDERKDHVCVMREREMMMMWYYDNFNLHVEKNLKKRRFPPSFLSSFHSKFWLLCWCCILFWWCSSKNFWSKFLSLSHWDLIWNFWTWHAGRPEANVSVCLGKFPFTTQFDCVWNSLICSDDTSSIPYSLSLSLSLSDFYTVSHNAKNQIVTWLWRLPFFRATAEKVEGSGFCCFVFCIVLSTAYYFKRKYFETIIVVFTIRWRKNYRRLFCRVVFLVIPMVFLVFSSSEFLQFGFEFSEREREREYTLIKMPCSPLKQVLILTMFKIFCNGRNTLERPRWRYVEKRKI